MICFVIGTKGWLLICIAVAIVFFWGGFILSAVFGAGAKQDEIMEKWDTNKEENLNEERDGC